MPDWIGDVVMAFSLLSLLRKRYPHDEIVVATRSHLKDLYAYQNYADRIVSWDKQSGWREFLGIVYSLRKEKFDIGFLCPNSFSSALMMTLAKVKKRIGYRKDGRSFLLHETLPLPKSRLDKHNTRVYMALAFSSWEGSVPKDLSVNISIDSDEQEQMRQTLREISPLVGKRFISFGLTSAHGETKNWSPERYRLLGLKLAKEYEAKILLLGTKKDKQRAQFIVRGMQDTFIDLTEQTNLKNIQVIISLSFLFVGGDSGLTHIASLLDIPTIALFGSTSPIFSRPQGKQVTVIYPKEECSPCFKRICPLGTIRCMKKIRMEDVLQSAQDLLKKEELIV